MEATTGRRRIAGRPELAGGFALVVLAGAWSWWALESGAWFGVVLLPGALLLCAALIVLCAAAPPAPALRRSPAAAIALTALVALAGWAALSALWSPAPDVALADGQRVAVYAVAFALGLWGAGLLRERAALFLAPLAVAGAIAGVATAIAMITTSAPATLLEGDGTLEHPLGYRNANAAFFLLAFLPALGLASDRELDWRARGPALAAAAICLGLGLLSQSRGSVPAALVALVAYVLLSPLRLRAVCWLAIAAAPAAVLVVPRLSELFRVANDAGVAATAAELEAAGLAVLAAGAIALLAGAAAARFEHRLPGLGSTTPRANLGIAAALAAAVLGAGAAFVVATGDPVDWTVKRADEFRAGTPDLAGESTRFTLNFGTDRYDLWRVAVDDARAEPLLGTGAGGFQYSYLRGRESTSQTARDAHSIQLELLGELGIPGLALLVLLLAAAAIAALRSRRAGPRAALLAAIALSVAAYWLAHASIDWLWSYPAITAPVLALLGSAAAPGALAASAAAPHRPAARTAIAAAAALLAASAVPPFLSERYVNEAYGGWRGDLERSYADLERARALNPLSDAPLLAEGGIAAAASERERALAAFREAAELRPEEWAAHLHLARLEARTDPREARRHLAEARQLNPNGPEIAALARRLSEPGP